MKDTRERILAAATELWRAGTQPTIQSVAAATGIAASTIYHHYADLDTLLDDMYLAAFAGLLDDDLKAFEGRVDTPETMAAYIMAPERDQYRLMRLEAMAHYRTRPALAASIRTLQRNYEERLRALIGENAPLILALGEGSVLALAELTKGERDRFAQAISDLAAEHGRRGN